MSERGDVSLIPLVRVLIELRAPGCSSFLAIQGTWGVFNSDGEIGSRGGESLKFA